MALARSCRHALPIAAALILAGCASYRLEPLDARHPASPEAPAAPAPPPSRTLAYAPSDIPSVQPVPAAAAARAGEQGPQATGRTVGGEGEVVATVPKAGQVVLEHGEIAGFMEAMTMGYRIEPPALLQQVKPGDSIRFTIDVDRRAIIAIEKLK